MAHFDLAKVGPDQFTFQVGTLSGNPIAAAAGLKTLEILKRDGAYETQRKTGRRLMTALESGAENAGLPATIVGDPVLFDIVFAAGPMHDYRDTLRTSADLQGAFNASLRTTGILKAPMKFYASLAHNDEDLEFTERAIKHAMDACRRIA